MNSLAKIKPESMPTKKQLIALRAIYKFQKTHGRFPSIRELSEEMGLSETGAQSHLTGLQTAGFLTPPEFVRVQDITPAGLKWVKP